MNTYIVMLRGINLGSHFKIKMDDLKSSFEALGNKKVRTYIQSGNVIFESGQADIQKLSTIIKNKILTDFGFNVPVIMRNIDEMTKTAANNPYLKRNGLSIEKLHVTFLQELPDKSTVEILKEISFLPDEFVVEGKEIYLYCPGGYGKTKLNNNFFERKLKMEATTRNWKTVNELVALSHQE
jgi:uncharacterized protein (DUF1697 family)